MHFVAFWRWHAQFAVPRQERTEVTQNDLGHSHKNRQRIARLCGTVDIAHRRAGKDATEYVAGVSTVNTYVVKRIDSDFFENESVAEPASETETEAK